MVLALLDFPQDGKVFTHVLKKDVWPKKKSDYDRHETVELAFGKAIRSKSKHRDDEKDMAPGIVFGDGVLDLQGGWRVHKRVNWHSDHFDGLFQARLRLAVNAGEVEVAVDKLDLKWRRSWYASFGDAVIPGQIVNDLETFAEERLKNDLQKAATKAVREKLPKLLGIEAETVSASIVTNGLRIRFIPTAGKS